MPRVPFNENEKKEFQRSFRKRFVDHQSEVELVSLYEENKQLIQEFGEFMKDELGRNFGGMYANSDDFGMTEFLPWYIGDPHWKSRDYVAETTPGADETTVNFIDQGSGFHLTGSTGFDNPIRIGNPVGHLILGYRSLGKNLADEAEDPVLTTLKFWKNEKPINVWHMENRLRGSERRIFQADKPIRLVPGDSFSAELYGGLNDGTDVPQLIGVSFIHGEWLRERRASAFVGESMESPSVVGSGNTA